MKDFSELKKQAELARDNCPIWYAADCFSLRHMDLGDSGFVEAADPRTVLALIEEHDLAVKRLCACRDCGGRGEIYSGHDSYQGHFQPPEPEMDVCATCDGDGVLGPLEDFESLAAEKYQLKYENDRMRKLLMEISQSSGDNWAVMQARNLLGVEAK